MRRQNQARQGHLPCIPFKTTRSLSQRLYLQKCHKVIPVFSNHRKLLARVNVPINLWRQTFHLYRDLNFWQLSYFAEDYLENEFVYSSRKCHWSTNLNLFDYHFLPRVQLDQGAQSLQCLTTFGRRCAWLCHWWAGLTSIKQSIHVTWIISTQSFTRIRTMMERLLFKRHKRDNRVITGRTPSVFDCSLRKIASKKVLSSATFG